jgi:UDP-N-acetylglucosamine 2-epimerase (non-hydrolysing)
LQPGEYGLVTLHRPANVDQPQNLAAILEGLAGLAARLPLVFPVHPRTRARLEQFRLWDRAEAVPGLTLIEPQGYVDFMSLVTSCRLAVTDSGGIQEETTYLGIPCLTLRPNTERPITVTQGTNRLVKIDELESSALSALEAKEAGQVQRPDLWDGHTAVRVADSLARRLD